MRSFTDDMLTFTERTLRGVCDALGADLVEFNGEADHVHLLVSYPPALAISALVQRLKGRTAYEVRREHTGACVRARMRERLWSPSYFAVSCGGAPLSIIKQYSTGKTDHSERRATPDDTHGMGSPRTKVRGLRPRIRSPRCSPGGAPVDGRRQAAQQRPPQAGDITET